MMPLMVANGINEFSHKEEREKHEVVVCDERESEKFSVHIIYILDISINHCIILIRFE